MSQGRFIAFNGENDFMIIARKPQNIFVIKLAGISIEVQTLYRQTKKFCKEYLTGERAKVSTSVELADVREERKLSDKQMKYEGHQFFYYFNSFYEPTALCRKIMPLLIAYNIILFHGAAVAVNGKAYIFTAKSGVGKTTHCRLWIKNILECHILNGDKPLLLFKQGKIYACGSPWMGKENYGTNEILPLEGICLLERDQSNHIEEVSLKESFEAIMNQCYIPDGNGNLAKVVSMIKQLSNIKLYHLGCNTEDEAARVAYQAMVKNKVK